MKNKAFIFTVLVLILGSQIKADVWRVNNRVILGQTVSADFTTLQAAIDDVNVLANDTLYIAGSPTAYGNGVFDKPLVVIGTGYFLTDNDTTQAYENQSQVGQLTFNAGSEGSVVMGIYIYYSTFELSPINAVVIATDSITLKKNRVYCYNTFSGNFSSNSSARAITVAVGAQNVHIMQNFIQSREGIGTNWSSYGLVIGAGAKCIVSNNIFKPGNLSTPTLLAIYTSSDATNDITISNNVFYEYDLVTYYSTHVNNILINGTYNNGTGDYTTYNLCSGTQYPDEYGNQRNITMEDVFVEVTSTVDSGFVLKPGSPAIAAGLNGGDCGVFSFDTGPSYVLSGMPDIPAIFSFTLTNTVGVDLFPINIKAISHNEGK